MIDITAIKRTPEGRAGEVAELLLPKGVLEGREWCVGSIQGEPGRSLKVCVSGAKAGVWTDFAAGGDGGDLIDLWCAVKQLQLPEALEEIRAWLGLEKPQFEKREKAYRRPAKPSCTAPKSAVKDYLTGARKLSERAIAAYRIGEQGRTIVFPSLVDSELRFVKYRPIDDKRKMRVEPDCEPVLFGWQVIDRNAREVTICEGEIDAPSLFDYGFPALSVPFGGGKGEKQRWIEAEYERLLRFETIYLALDNDPEGEAAVEEIVARLGRHRCRRVILPHKDANDCLTAGIPEAEIRRCFETAATMDPPELVRAGQFTDDVIRLFWPVEGQRVGYTLPYGKVRDRLLFRPGEFSIWTGPSGHGKSQILSHAGVEWGNQGAKVCIASLEMAPPQFLRRMVKQAGNVDRPTEPFIRKIMGWMDEWLWTFNLVGKTGVQPLLDVFEYARCRYGCDVFVIDSLMRLGIGSEDYQGQEQAVFTLVNWTVEKGVHIHLVAHSRKADTKTGGTAPETEDIKGASEIGSNAFNILGVWRNRKLEDQIKQLSEKADRGDGSAASELDNARNMPPVILNIAKQRNGDWEGKCGLWFDNATYKYRSSQDSRFGVKYVSLDNGVEDAA
ncbi:AAA family ATPase [Azospirillum argentinense]